MIGSIDITVIVIYFLCIIFIGFISMFRSNRSNIVGYFLAGQYMTWLPVGASLFASNIGSEHFIGLAGSGAAKGIGVGAFELNAAIMLQLLGWVFLPVFIQSGAYTLPEYMKKRFGGQRIQCYLAIISLIMYIFTKISVNLYSASLFIYEAVQFNIWISVLALLALTGLITVTGGLAAVLYTDTFQCLIMLVGSIILTIISFIKVGGITGLFEKYGKSIAHVNVTDLPDLLNSSYLHCYLPSEKAFQMLRPINDKDMPWLGFIFGQTPASIWYWCADQMMVQRVLASKDLSHAKGGTLFAGLLKLLPLFIMVMPGMISRVLYPNEIACATPENCFKVCGQLSGCTNIAYPKLVMNLLPDGLRGLMLSVMLAALVSDLTSIFNSASTLFTVDIYRFLRPKAANRELMIVGRSFVLVMIVLSVLWLPVIQNMQGGQLFIYIQAVSGFLSPPIAAIYILAILWKRGTEKGALSGLIYGLIIGSIRMIMDFVWKEVPCVEVDTRPSFIRNMHYMYFAFFSFISCGIVMIIVSLSTKSKLDKNTQDYTFWSYWKRKDHAIAVVELSLTEKLVLTNGVVKEELVNSSHSKFSCKAAMSYLWSIFLGINEKEDAKLVQNDEDQKCELERSVSKRLSQSTLTRIILNIIMVFQITFVVICFIVFSVFTPILKIGEFPIFNNTLK